MSSKIRRTAAQDSSAISAPTVCDRSGSTTVVQAPDQHDVGVVEEDGPTLHDQLEIGSHRHAFQQALPGLVLCLSQAGDCRAVTPTKGLERWGLPSKILGRNIFDLLPADSREAARSSLQTARATGKTQAFHCSIDLRHGTRHLEAHLAVTAQDDFVIVVSDITQIRELETVVSKLLAALHSSPERTVKALLPVCAGCNRVRKDLDEWQEMDDLLREISLSSIAHLICPDCKYGETDRHIDNSSLVS